MSYLVLARKYRPRRFDELVGQEHVVQALSNALTQQRLHHAYLFTGTRGVGKTTVSRILAKSLNCQGPDGQGGITAQPCGVCAACTDIDSGRFVDYTELDAASNRSVDEVQALLEQAVYKPVQGRFKVFMIDEVHMLTGHAFNAMLKTLEEPPAYLKFVLATTDPQKVPVTVLSRCLQFNLRPMAMRTLQEHLSRVLGQESVPSEPGALRLLSRAARGSMRDALSLADQAIAFGGGTISEDSVRRMLGSVDAAHAKRLIEALAQADGRAVVELCDGLRREGLSAAATLEEMAAVLQRMAVWQATGQAEPDSDAADADNVADDEASLASMSQQLDADETQLLYSLCLHGRAELGLAPDEYAALVMVLLRFMAFAQPAQPAEKKSLNPRPRAEPPRLERPQRSDSPELQAAALAKPLMAQEAQALGVPQQAALDVPPPAVVQTLQTPQTQSPAVNHAPPPPVLDAQPQAVLNVPLRVATEPSARTEPRRLAPLPVEPIPGFASTDDADFWHETVTALVEAQAITALARELALQSQLMARDEGHWLLRVESEMLNQAGSKERLQTALTGFGHAVRVTVEVGPVHDSPARRLAAAQSQRLEQAKRTILEDPFVQRMVQEFGAKIIPGSIQPI